MVLVNTMATKRGEKDVTTRQGTAVGARPRVARAGVEGSAAPAQARPTRSTRPRAEAPRQDEGLPREVVLAIDDAKRERKSNFEPIVYAWSVGIYIFDNTWKLAFTKNTRPGFKQLAQFAEFCELHAVKFSVFVDEPSGMRALDVLVDVPTGSRDSSTQRACVELEDRRHIDLVQWLDGHVPKVNQSSP
jgi:hypothetical protein